MSSPHTRGSSDPSGGLRRAEPVVPAHAGVIRCQREPRRLYWGRPRTRGGHPAAAARTSSRRMSSPHTRGSSAGVGGELCPHGVVPAHAGVIRLPGPGGAGPVGRPRTRGGHPCGCSTTPSSLVSSPHTRGSSADASRLRVEVAVVPAHAGVIPGPARSAPGSASRPRTRGGHPLTPVGPAVDTVSSPHTRGSSPASLPGEPAMRVVPAHAGVIRPPPMCWPPR